MGVVVTNTGSVEATQVPLAVAFSGGGFRASLAGLGVIRFLAQAGLLGQVKYVSSVSGGTWAGALLAVNWDELERRKFTLAAVDDVVVRPFVDRVTGTSLQGRMMARMPLAILTRKTRTDLLADAFDEWFGGGMCLADLPDNSRCRFMINATNLTTGKRYRFEREKVGDWIGINNVKRTYITPETPTEDGQGEGIQIRIADALGASAAIPGAMAPQRLVQSYRYLYKKKKDQPLLVDGAVYDNLGTEALGHLGLKRPLVVSIDSGAPLHSAKIQPDFFGVLKRSQKVIQNQTALVRRRWLAENFKQWQLWRTASPQDYADYNANIELAEQRFAEWQDKKRSESRELAGPPPPFPPEGARRGVTYALDSPTEGGLGSSISTKHYAVEDGPPEVPAWRNKAPDKFIKSVAEMPMSVKKLDPMLCRDVIYRSWWLSRAFLTTYHDDVVPREPHIENWSEWYGG